jgi:hypothetical protein
MAINRFYLFYVPSYFILNVIYDTNAYFILFRFLNISTYMFRSLTPLSHKKV